MRVFSIPFVAKAVILCNIQKFFTLSAKSFGMLHRSRILLGLDRLAMGYMKVHVESVKAWRLNVACALI